MAVGTNDGIVSNIEIIVLNVVLRNAYVRLLSSFSL